MNENLYGDRLAEGIAGRGVDIAAQRADDLDRLALEYLRALPYPRVLEIGCGSGGQSVRMANAGAAVVGVDLHDFSAGFAVMAAVVPSPGALEFRQGDISEVLPTLGTFDAAVSQRTLHYLPYPKAVDLLTSLRKQVQGKLFISATGLGTEIGQDYPDAGKPVEERFEKVGAAMARKHHIHEAVCLYSADELRGLLIKAGWLVDKEDVYLSAFGNVKAVAKAA